MDLFKCYLCDEQYATELKNTHHKMPQSAGGDDSQDNLVDLCSGCHQTMHAIARMMKNPSKVHYVEDTVKMYFPAEDQSARCRELAFLIVKYDTLKEDGQLDLSDKNMMITIEIPILYHSALRTIANEHRDPDTGRKMGMNNYTKRLLLDHLEKMYPKIKNAKTLSELLESPQKNSLNLNFQKL